ncbi:hypothetical protein OHB04_02195 [Streptomyces sp. NBC_01775]|uniref:hypothetical protein n=1 Tax=Streptomyces sp. NBC_01775 TaxID=2975939 RepID=UPI002DDC86A7|nr:hypothetical protein [Streptomyces sp. NBC_01775]WSB74703.1 hypothetical protein OHB04_02195 [Streptomyces sp. NBC_01775]
MTADLVAFLRRLLGGVPYRRARGGVLRPARKDDDSVLVALSPGKQITDPDEAEALGMTAEARWLREGRYKRPAPPGINSAATSPYRQGLRRGMRGKRR